MSMRKTGVILLAIGLIVGIVVGYGSAFYQAEVGKTSEASTGTEKMMLYLCDSAIFYVKEHHADAAENIPAHISWSGGRTTPEGLVGHETYVYEGDGWKTTIEYNVVAPENMVYELTAEYEGITWKGTVSHGLTSEINYDSTQAAEPPKSITIILEPEKVRDEAMLYIKSRHPDADPLIPYNISWSGGRATPEGLVGHETHVYTGNEWTVTIEWNVVAPQYMTYKITAECSGINWTGTVHGCTLTETSYQTS